MLILFEILKEAGETKQRGAKNRQNNQRVYRENQKGTRLSIRERETARSGQSRDYQLQAATLNKKKTKRQSASKE